MKIIKEPDSNWTMRYTCTTCTAELELNKDDVSYTRYDGDMRDPGYDTWTSTCPCCSTTINIKESSLPAIVRVHIKKRCSTSFNYYDR